MKVKEFFSNLVQDYRDAREFGKTVQEYRQHKDRNDFIQRKDAGNIIDVIEMTQVGSKQKRMIRHHINLETGKMWTADWLHGTESQGDDLLPDVLRALRIIFHYEQWKLGSTNSRKKN